MPILRSQDCQTARTPEDFCNWVHRKNRAFSSTRTSRRDIRLRKISFAKKFEAGRRYIFSEVFTWLDRETKLTQVAVLTTHPQNRHDLAGGKLISIDELTAEIRSTVQECGILAKNAIAEQYPLLRTMQLTHNGYYRTH